MSNKSSSKSEYKEGAKKLPPLPKIAQIAMLVDVYNYSQVDLYAQHILRVLPDDPHANLACAWVANHFSLTQKQDFYLDRVERTCTLLTLDSATLADDLRINLDVFNITAEQRTRRHEGEIEPRYHVAKAWGFGFGSEMTALMGQAYLAEAIGRELIVHWGSNFLYRPSPGKNCVFHHFFEAFNTHSISDVSLLLNDVYPPKWNLENINDEHQGKRTGEYSKLSALYFFNRPESLTVSDYYVGVVNSQPWVDPAWPLSHLSIDDAYRYLAKKYLSPKQSIVAEVDAFIEEHLSQPYVAVHARGSDKDEGYRALTSIPGQILACAKQRLSELPSTAKLFLMTDDMALLDIYKQEFGDRLVQTECQRCDTQVGVHYDQDTDKLSAGREMLIDMLVAAKALCFVGLGLSNPSQLIPYFGDFSDENYILFGENRLKQLNTHLYKTISVRRK